MFECDLLKANLIFEFEHISIQKKYRHRIIDGSRFHDNNSIPTNSNHQENGIDIKSHKKQTTCYEKLEKNRLIYLTSN